MRISSLVVAVAAGLLACAPQGSPVSEFLRTRAALGPGTVIDLTDGTDFRWDRFYLFEPYTRPERVEQRLGTAVPGLRSSSSLSQDGYMFCVFALDGRVVRSFDHPRRGADLFPAVRESGYTPDEAVFVVSVREKDDWTFLEPLATVAE